MGATDRKPLLPGPVETHSYTFDVTFTQGPRLCDCCISQMQGLQAGVEC